MGMTSYGSDLAVVTLSYMQSCPGNILETVTCRKGHCLGVVGVHHYIVTFIRPFRSDHEFENLVQATSAATRHQILLKCILVFVRKSGEKEVQENSIRDASTPQPGKILFNTMRYRSSET